MDRRALYSMIAAAELMALVGCSASTASRRDSVIQPTPTTESYIPPTSAQSPTSTQETDPRVMTRSFPVTYVEKVEDFETAERVSRSKTMYSTALEELCNAPDERPIDIFVYKTVNPLDLGNYINSYGTRCFEKRIPISIVAVTEGYLPISKSVSNNSRRISFSS